jgi:hypothetical protein
MNAKEKRQKVADSYSIILGRNIYNQDLRDYCYTPYSDGNYYSDCSSSISYAYKKAGFGFGILNTADMYYNLDTVPNLGIKNGVPVDISLLRIGDMFLFAGNDASRPRCIGHVEMIYSINSDGSVTLCGHGSGNPSTKDMEDYCTSRYNQWASGGWRKGLVCVKRYIQDDEDEEKNGWIKETDGWKYYENNVAVSNKWIQSADENDWYYIGEDEIMETDKWIKSEDGNDWYYVGSDGKMLKSCTQNINGYEQDFDSSGKWIKHTGWYNERYYNGDTNMYVKNDWVKDSEGRWAWLDDNGKMVKDTWSKDKEGNYYYLGSDGFMLTNCDVDWKGKTYHLDSNGRCTN